MCPRSRLAVVDPLTKFMKILGKQLPGMFPHYGFLQAENCYKRADCELHIHYFAWLAAASRELR